MNTALIVIIIIIILLFFGIAPRIIDIALTHVFDKEFNKNSEIIKINDSQDLQLLQNNLSSFYVLNEEYILKEITDFLDTLGIKKVFLDCVEISNSRDDKIIRVFIEDVPTRHLDLLKLKLNSIIASSEINIIFLNIKTLNEKDNFINLQLTNNEIEHLNANIYNIYNEEGKRDLPMFKKFEKIIYPEWINTFIDENISYIFKLAQKKKFNELKSKYNLISYDIDYNVREENYLDIITLELKVPYIKDKEYLQNILYKIKCDNCNSNILKIELNITDQQRKISLYYSYMDIEKMNLEEMNFENFLSFCIKVAI